MSTTKDAATERPWKLHDRWLFSASGPLAIASGYQDWVTAPGGSKYEEWKANAALIVEAVNSHDSLLAKNADLIKALEESRAAMLRMRAASIAGCEEGYGKPEKWGDELFASHGPVTAAIKAIDAAIGKART